MNIGWYGSSALMSSLAVAGLMAPWKSMAMSTSSPTALRSSANLLGGVADLGRASRRSAPAAAWPGPVLKAVKPRPSSSLICLGRAGVGVDADPVARRAAEQLVDRHAQRLALDVPQGHVDAAQGAGQDRPAAIEGVAVDGLPVMHHLARVLADQVRLDLLDRPSRTVMRPALDDRLAQADDAGVGVDLQEQPARLDQEGFQSGDSEGILRATGAPLPTRSSALASARVNADRPTAAKAPASTDRRLTFSAPWCPDMGMLLLVEKGRGSSSLLLGPA